MGRRTPALWLRAATHLVGSISKFNKPWKAATSNRLFKMMWVHKNAKRCTNSVSTSPPQLQQDPESLKALGMHWVDQKTSVKTYFICGHHFSLVQSDFHSWPKKKKSKKMKSKVLISKPYWFFFSFTKTQPCLSIKNRMSKGLNLCHAKNPNFLLTSRKVFWVGTKAEEARRGLGNQIPRPRSSQPYFRIPSPHSTKFWVEISHSRYQRALWEMSRCKWKQDSQQTCEDLYCVAGTAPAQTQCMTFKLPF